jgi:hypothetical protein
LRRAAGLDNGKFRQRCVSKQLDGHLTPSSGIASFFQAFWRDLFFQYGDKGESSGSVFRAVTGHAGRRFSLLTKISAAMDSLINKMIRAMIESWAFRAWNASA